MDSWRQSLTACWHSVAMTLPEGLQESLSHLGQSLGQSLGLGTGDVGGGTAAGQEYELQGRRLRVLRQLGEGGYSFVYLVRQLQPGPVHGGSAGGGQLAAAAAAPGAGQLWALKRVLCGSEEQLREAEHEVAVMLRLRHPCLLALEAASTQLQGAPDGGSRHVVLLLFPVYDGGNLFDFVQRVRAAQEAERGQPAAVRRAVQLRELATLLRIFLQVCAALHAMHSQELAHRDVKPQNVLLRPRQQLEQPQQPQQQHAGGGTAAAKLYDPAPSLLLADPRKDQSLQRQEEQQAEGPAGGEQGWAADSWHSNGDAAGRGAAAAAVAAYSAAGAQAEHAGASEGGQQQRQQEEAWWAERLRSWRREHEAVLMDFGSTRPALVEVRNRAQAMAAQEDAERQCTAPYRAPELWDVASSCTLDERVDVWSLGCLLYYCLCGESPFERAAGEAGGSLMLAVVNGRLSWPAEAAELPEGVRALVGLCLDTDPSTRPRVAEVARAADGILASLLL